MAEMTQAFQFAYPRVPCSPPAGRPEKGKEFAGTDIEIDRLQHVIVAVGQVHLLDADTGGRNGGLIVGC